MTKLLSISDRSRFGSTQGQIHELGQSFESECDRAAGRPSCLLSPFASLSPSHPNSSWETFFQIWTGESRPVRLLPSLLPQRFAKKTDQSKTWLFIVEAKTLLVATCSWFSAVSRVPAAFVSPGRYQVGASTPCSVFGFLLLTTKATFQALSWKTH